MSYPKITVDLKKLKSNIDRTVSMAHGAGLSCALVTKCVCADAQVMRLVNASEADMVADSRLRNLAGMDTKKPKLLLRIAQPSEAEDVARYADISLESTLSTIMRIGDEARKQWKRHKVILMVDMGDLREGIFYKNTDAIYEAAEAIVSHKGLELYGLGVNLTCFGGILPDENNLSGLVAIANDLRKRLGVEIPVISGGNSSMMTMLRNNAIPQGINHIRLGEAYLLGNDTAACELMDGFYDDAFILTGEIAELYRKPSKPIGTSGANAFGEHVEFPDRGEMLRAIVALGRQDTEIGGLTPVDGNVEILGASSDHLILNLTHADGYAVGSTVDFKLDYGALLHAFTGGYIQREYK